LGRSRLCPHPLAADSTAAFGAELDGELVGSNFATRWGSVGLFGPVSVHPDLWDQDIGQRLMEPVMACFRTWGVQHAGLFTFAHSPKHVGLYQSDVSITAAPQL
jgi:GNAT superfamily N-acetyltransferase